MCENVICMGENKNYDDIINRYGEIFWIMSRFYKEGRLRMIYGHQGSFLNDTFWKLGRWLVRYIWTPLELIGFNNPGTPPADNYQNARQNEKIENWAEYHKLVTIAGHTHRPSYPDKGGYYYNSGSLVHPRCITAIEIENEEIKLVKWCISPDKCNHLTVCRELL